FSYRAGTLSDRFGRWKIILVGWCIYAVVYAGFGMAGQSSLWLLFLLYGFYTALTDGVTKALVVDTVGEELRGTAIGYLNLIVGLSALTSNVIAGYLWDHLSHQAPFLLGSASAIVAVILALRFAKSPPAH